jgi:hypothetical protein
MAKPIVEIITKFSAADGKVFDTEAEADAWDVELLKTPEQKSFEQFLNSYSMSYMTKKGITLETVGYWRAQGEGEDRAGRILGYVHGTLEAAIRWAVVQKGWYSWGGGGSIDPFDITELPVIVEV